MESVESWDVLHAECPYCGEVEPVDDMELVVVHECGKCRKEYEVHNSEN